MCYLTSMKKVYGFEASYNLCVCTCAATVKMCLICSALWKEAPLIQNDVQDCNCVLYIPHNFCFYLFTPIKTPIAQIENYFNIIKVEVLWTVFLKLCKSGEPISGFTPDQPCGNSPSPLPYLRFVSENTGGSAIGPDSHLVWMLDWTLKPTVAISVCCKCEEGATWQLVVMGMFACTCSSLECHSGMLQPDIVADGIGISDEIRRQIAWCSVRLQNMLGFFFLLQNFQWCTHMNTLLLLVSKDTNPVLTH